ncbi:lysophospholipid acyltransferase family protein [Mobilicoccus pelagius]|uniref:Putative acyltransferase n=1 Tax=Mobilicoccus pelagius NBRC 104925 TaxID=1089455 RepID=H5UNG2_9MICO|nr:lysophospholipid acyltransferase family protein [Mobilicoccus pelagius]GAB47270.1 putative acyltransferase [Mobilicoccus pelagius NBRC 104925]
MAFSKVLQPGIERSFAYRSATASVLGTVRAITRADWQGMEHLPSGGCVVAANHISYADPFAVAQFLLDNGHPPFFLAKDSLFRIPVLGRWFAATGQVPVHRGTGRAASAYAEACAAVRAGRTIVVMPEATITKDPDLWPMRAKSGVVRIALATGCPLVPLGQWGAQELVPRGSTRLRPWPRKTIHMRVGPPVDLADLAAGTVTRDDLVAAGDRVMDAITGLVAEIRGETPPSGRWDPALGRRVPAHLEEQP